MAAQPTNPDIIQLLNDILTMELTAINQYFLHAEMCENWGYHKLYEVIRKESIDEMKHAESLIERILYLEGTPNVQKLGRIYIGETVDEQLKLDLTLERQAIPALNEAIQRCRDAADNGTRVMLDAILDDEEQHVDWLEAQLTLIDQVGLQNYLAQQI